MAKVTPLFFKVSTHVTSPTPHVEEPDDDLNFFEEDTDTNVQTTTKRTTRYLNCPLKVFLMTTLISLIIICAVAIYMAVFIGMYTSVNELSNKTVSTVEGQVKNYIDKFLGGLKMSSNLAASHFNNGLISKKDYRQYLYQGFKNSGAFVGYFLYSGNISERFSYTTINGNFLYTYQENGFPGIIRDKVNITTSQIIKYNFTVSTAPLSLMTTPFYTSAVAETSRLKVEGVFGGPFYTVGGDIGLPYSTTLYDPSVYPSVKILKGVCRATVPLYLLSDYLSKVAVFQKGYVLLTELNSTEAVAGSIQTTTSDGSTNLSLFSLTQKDAGKLMTDISEKYNGLENLPEKIFISSKGVQYIITISTYKFDNLEWRLYIIAYDEDVNFTTNLSIGISMGVSAIILLSAIIYSAILSRTITRTVKYLEQQLVFVKTFDLDKVTLSSSIFKEMNQIIDDLDTTVMWLKQVKSFIPATVFYQIKGETEETTHDNESEKKDKSKAKYSFQDETHTTYESNSKHKTSSSTLKDHHTNSLFKLGLHKKTCCILHIMFNKFELHASAHDISITFSKVSTMIRNIANMYQAHFQINSTEEIVIVIDQKPNKKHPSELAVECSLKISGILVSTNNLLKEHDNFTLDYFMGLSTSNDSFVGNLGSQAFRFYSFVSNSRRVATNLSILACSLGVRILVDEETFNNINQTYITKPVDRLCIVGSVCSSHSSEICNVYELIKEKSIAQDEWLYELNNLTLNKEIESLNAIFSIFKNAETSYSQLEHYLVLMNEYLSKYPNDPAITHLISILEYYKRLREKVDSDEILHMDTYCSKIHYQILSVQSDIYCE